MTQSLKGRTMLISGASRGIGLAIALAAAKEGANIAVFAKTGEPHPKLEGTVYTAAEQIEAAGGHALPMVGDVRDADSVAGAVAQTVEKFGGIDICVNNASALNLASTEAIDIKRYDLMQSINVRGTFLLSKACIPYLKNGTNPHILTLSPPITMRNDWLGAMTAYALSKYGMTLVAMGLAGELAEAGVASNTLWPRTLVSTVAVRNLLGGDDAIAATRTTDLYSDSAMIVLTSPSREFTGKQLLCEDVLVDNGVTDLDTYAVSPGRKDLRLCLFVDEINPPGHRG